MIVSFLSRVLLGTSSGTSARWRRSVALGAQSDWLCSAFVVPGGACPAGDPATAGVRVAPGHTRAEGVSWRSDHSSGLVGLCRQHNTILPLVYAPGQGDVWFGTK